ncbi:sugar ABC transporter ATP-binding protein [Sulfobacillus thermosulfidooxidans]|uniref:sugar ABC transporter ATP-binding protein n=1 Tax=Sulfobacillus thermosulfidooxidans TaxID=28034 RepID=UPI0002E43F5D|nr:sugar ABC transporter ATP-binding protein [Sulfobacillus thermosulfidooxidans]
MLTVGVCGVSKTYGGTKALNDVSLKFPARAVTAIVGENGAGKSTLIKILMGVTHPDSGYVSIDGHAVHIGSPAHARNLGFAAVYQEPMVFPQLSVLENIFMSRLPATRWGNISRGAMVTKVTPIFEQLNMPVNLLHEPIMNLSLGFQQIVLIAQALVFKSNLIIFDEPTAILSSGETERLFAIIQQLRNAGQIILYVSHRLDELSVVADRVAVLTDGTVVMEHENKEWDAQQLVSEMSGNRVYKSVQAVPGKELMTEKGPKILEVRELSSNRDYKDVSFYVKQGEIVGFYGQVGAGRSEVMQTIFGVRTAQQGRVFLKGQPITIKSPTQAIRAGIAYLPEDRKDQGLFMPRSITQNMMVSVIDKFKRIGGLLKISLLQSHANRLSKELKIKLSNVNGPVSSLSGGGQQKVLFARWLTRDDLSVMIFDEPTRGIDVATKNEIHELIRQLAQRGMAVIVVSSDLPEILDLCSRIYVMRQGAIVGEFDGNLTNHEDILALSIGLARSATNEGGAMR